MTRRIDVKGRNGCLERVTRQADEGDFKRECFRLRTGEGEKLHLEGL